MRRGHLERPAATDCSVAGHGTLHTAADVMPARPDIRQEKVSKSVATSSTSHGSLEFHPLTPDRWHDLEALFGARGACGGCWCMWWRLTRAEFDRQKGDGNRAAFRQLVESGTVAGVLAYDRHDPAGWCAIQPRNAYPALGDKGVAMLGAIVSMELAAGKTPDEIAAVARSACEHGFAPSGGN